MFEKDLSDVSIADIEALVNNGVREARNVEYKLTLPGNSDEDKREFLADVSSLANAAGGHLIYGMQADDGVPTLAIGLEDFNEDQVRLRLESILRDGLDPRLPAIQLHTIPSFPKGPVLVIRVPRSWIAPHRVKYRGSSRFWSRSSVGKFEMDTSEIRTSFEGSGDLPRRVREWRDERLGRILANEGALPLPTLSALIVHLIPLESLDSPWRFHASEFRNLATELKPMNTSGWNHRLNLDGFVTYSPYWEDTSQSRSYTQLFRSGAIEAVDADAISVRDGNRWLPSIAYEQEIITAVTTYLACLKKLGIQPPILFLLCLLNGKGARLATGSRMHFFESHGIDRNVLNLPDVFIADFDSPIDKALKPAFDAIWNACGFERSFNYDDQGNWSPRS